MRGPDGILTRVSARHDHDQWWGATLEGRGEGVYRVHASARAFGAELTGATTFEVAEPDAAATGRRPGRTRSAASSTSARDGAARVRVDPNHPVVWVSADAAKQLGGRGA